MRRKSLGIIWGMFGVFIIIFILNFSLTINISANQRMFLVLQLWSVILSIILIVKNKLPNDKHIKISIILSFLVAISYYEVAIVAVFTGFMVTLLSSLAMFSTFEKFNYEKLTFLNNYTKKSIYMTIFLGVGAGVILGVVNLLLMSMSNTPNLHIKLSCFIVALSPAIYEEIVMRSLFYAFCIDLIDGKIETKNQKLTCWFMMIMPHVIVHTPDTFVYGGVYEGIIVIAMYILIFALPLTILQKKRDITSAMIAHGMIDFIRFCFYGMPF